MMITDLQILVGLGILTVSHIAMVVWVIHLEKRINQLESRVKELEEKK